jgi:hypothetical protein
MTRILGRRLTPELRARMSERMRAYNDARPKHGRQKRAYVRKPSRYPYLDAMTSEQRETYRAIRVKAGGRDRALQLMGLSI